MPTWLASPPNPPKALIKALCPLSRGINDLITVSASVVAATALFQRRIKTIVTLKELIKLFCAFRQKVGSPAGSAASALIWSLFHPLSDITAFPVPAEGPPPAPGTSVSITAVLHARGGMLARPGEAGAPPRQPFQPLLHRRRRLAKSNRASGGLIYGSALRAAAPCFQPRWEEF